MPRLYVPDITQEQFDFQVNTLQLVSFGESFPSQIIWAE